MEAIDNFFAQFVELAWSWPTAVLLLGAGIYFSIRTKLRPFTYLGHAFEVLMGKHPSKGDVGDVSHFKALTASLSGTIGLGNIAGVAVAIQLGGPGAIFWMWVTAIFGIATKFFTCTLSVLYRDVEPDGSTNAGTMYIIKNGLPKYMMPLAYFFAFFGIIAGLPAFQANQVVQLTNDLYFPNVENFEYIAGSILVVLTATVILGGLKRIADVSAWLVPFMGGLYFLAVLLAVLINYDQFFPAIGAHKDDDGGTDRGAVHILYMNTDGSVDSTVEINDSTTNGPELEDDDAFGRSVANIGDLDGDGVNDLIVGADKDNAGGANRGTIHIIHMNTDGSVKSTVEINNETTNGPSMSDQDFFGFAVANIGDLDGNGINDLAVGAYGDDGGTGVGHNSGAVHLIFLE